MDGSLCTFTLKFGLKVKTELNVDFKLFLDTNVHTHLVEMGRWSDEQRKVFIR